jgi:hypothetical protein
MADDRDRLALFALRVWGYKQGEMVSLMIHLSDRLGLYRAMAGMGPTTAAGLAAATGLQERWLLEWLRSQAAACLIDTADGETFELGREAVAVLGRGRTWDPRLSSRAGRENVPGSGVLALHCPRLRGPGRPLLRGSPLRPVLVARWRAGMAASVSRSIGV